MNNEMDLKKFRSRFSEQEKEAMIVTGYMVADSAILSGGNADIIMKIIDVSAHLLDYNKQNALDINLTRMKSIELSNTIKLMSEPNKRWLICFLFDMVSSVGYITEAIENKLDHALATIGVSADEALYIYKKSKEINKLFL
jgi:hypothetical protein